MAKKKQTSTPEPVGPPKKAPISFRAVRINPKTYPRGVSGNPPYGPWAVQSTRAGFWQDAIVGYKDEAQVQEVLDRLHWHGSPVVATPDFDYKPGPNPYAPPLAKKRGAGR